MQSGFMAVIMLQLQTISENLLARLVQNFI